jgi:2-phosphosulfolactate phosphatase
MDELYFKDRVTVVIDVLRATTTILTALNNGAKEIIPVASIEFAVKVSKDGKTILCGERNTKKIEGFTLGNSPLEFTPETVQGKSIVLFTTNGTRAISKAKFSSNLFIAAFSNISAVAEHLNELNKDVEIICAGRNNDFSIEDSVCAGKLISLLKDLNENLNLTDSAKVSLLLNEKWGNDIPQMMLESEHGKILLSNGFQDDIDYCSRLNIFTSIPFFSNNIIKL